VVNSPSKKAGKRSRFGDNFGYSIDNYSYSIDNSPDSIDTFKYSIDN
jgi:hypothetical protein